MTTPTPEPVYTLTESELRRIIRGVAAGTRARLSAAPHADAPQLATRLSLAQATERARHAQADEDAAWDDFLAPIHAYVGVEA